MFFIFLTLQEMVDFFFKINDIFMSNILIKIEYMFFSLMYTFLFY